MKLKVHLYFISQLFGIILIIVLSVSNNSWNRLKSDVILLYLTVKTDRSGNLL